MKIVLESDHNSVEFLRNKELALVGLVERSACFVGWFGNKIDGGKTASQGIKLVESLATTSKYCQTRLRPRIQIVVSRKRSQIFSQHPFPSRESLWYWRYQKKTGSLKRILPNLQWHHKLKQHQSHLHHLMTAQYCQRLWRPFQTPILKSNAITPLLDNLQEVGERTNKWYQEICTPLKKNRPTER